MTVGEKAAARAARYLGVTESPEGSNRGSDVDRWQRPWGMGYGWPWCGAFASAMVAWAITARGRAARPVRAKAPAMRAGPEAKGRETTVVRSAVSGT